MKATTASYGGIELGGTKIVAAIGDASGAITARTTIPTGAPEQAITQIIAFFRDTGISLAGLGVGAFGPIVIDPAAADYGQLLETNKPGWSGFNLARALTDALDVPLRLVTDVGAAAIGEARLGALRGAPLGIYITIGTGIGGAILAQGAILPARLHPELGHIPLHRLPGDTAPSLCRFHDHCAEGLIAGPAIKARFGRELAGADPDGPEVRLLAEYLGQLCANLALTLSPHRIVIGGGVSQVPGLLRAGQQAMLRQLGGYATGASDDPAFLCAPALGQDAGITGALLLGAEAAAPRS